MSAQPTSPVIEQQLAHRSVRAFRPDPIPAETLATVLRAGQAAASSSFIQAYSVIRVTRPRVRAAIAETAGGQAWVREAPELLVFCADLRRVDAACRRAGAGALEGHAEHALAALVDAALMAQNVLLAAESLGLGGVFIGGIRNDLGRVAGLLAVPRLVVPVFGMCLGVPAAQPEPKPRGPLDLVLHQDAYRDPEETAVAAYDAKMRDYCAVRSGGRRTGDWTAATAAAVQGKKRGYLLGFLQRQGYFLR